MIVMRNDRMLPDTATLYCSLGEVDYKKTYKPVLLHNVKFSRENGVSLRDNTPTDMMTIHYFDFRSSAFDTDGNPVQLIPYSEWFNKKDKTGYFAFSDKGEDYIIQGDVRLDTVELLKYPDSFKIERVDRLKAGTPRMWHWKLYGR